INMPGFFYGLIIRRGVYEAIRNGLRPEDVWKMTDDELKNSLASHGIVSRKTYERIRDRIESKTFLTLKIEGQEPHEEIRGKPNRIYGMPEEGMMKIVNHFGDINNAIKFEENVEDMFGFGPGSITVAEMPHIKLLRPKDIPLFDRERGWTSLYEKIPETEHDFSSDIRREYALRIGVIPEFRESAYEKSRDVLDILESFV
ncbi:MAG: hypothetical protein QMD85_02530, partial [Candidatus Aenigmarchaeota archaeon]|nr:hypothetical protein [Candidatus Aenigmarchaeota archaeon]MDI6722420.1 hypothetical protein [Candidatus Aenigmarchaeota archaeon]